MITHFRIISISINKFVIVYVNGEEDGLESYMMFVLLQDFLCLICGLYKNS